MIILVLSYTVIAYGIVILGPRYRRNGCFANSKFFGLVIPAS